MRTAQTRPSGGLAEVTGPRGGNPSVWPATFFAGKRLQDINVLAPPQQPATTPSSPSQANDPAKVSTGMEAEEAAPPPRHPHPASSDSASTLLDAALRGDESSPAYRRFYAVVEGKMRRWMLDRSSEDPGYVYEMSRLGENDHIQPGDPQPYNLTEFYQKMTISDVAPSVMSLFSNAAERKYEAQVEAELEDWPDPHRMRQWITTRTIPLRETHMLSAGVPELDQLLRSSWTRHASAPAPEPAAPLYTVPPTFPQFEIADVPVQHGGDFFSTFPNNAAFRGGDGAEDRMDYATRDMRPPYRVNDECMPWLADCALYPSPAPWTPSVQPLHDQHPRPSHLPGSRPPQEEAAAKTSPAAVAAHRSGGSMLFPNSAPSANPNYVPDEVLEEIFRSEDDITAQRLAPYSFADRLALARRRRHANHMPTPYSQRDDMDGSGVLFDHHSDPSSTTKAKESGGQHGSVATVNSSLARGSTAAGLPLIDVTAMSTATIGNAAQRAGAGYPLPASSSSSYPASSMHGHGAHLAPADAYEFVVKERDAPWRPIIAPPSSSQGHASRGGVARTSMASAGTRRLSMSDGPSGGASPTSNQRGVMRWVDWDDGN